MKKARLLLRIIGIIGLAGLPIVTLSTPVMADTPEPETVSLEDIVIFNSLLETDDFLAVVPYELSFDTNPDDNIAETYIFRLMSPDGNSELGTALAYPAYDDGYGNGLVSFYIASGMEQGEAYIFRVQQNPIYYSPAQYWDFPIGLINYSTEDNQAAALKDKIIDSATFLSTCFGDDLLTKTEAGTTVLSTYGELYYLNAIPGLQGLCPYLFSVQLENPDYTKRSWSFSIADALKTKYEGTFVYDFMTGYAGLFSMETTAAMNFLSIMLFAAVIGLAVWKFKATMLSGFIDGYTLLLLLMLMGMVDMVLVGAMAFLSSALGGVILFLNRA